MGKLLREGDGVKLIRDRSQDNRDRFGRLLRYVERGDKDVGKKQIARGWAEVFVFERPFKRVKKYRSTERAAEGASRRVWAMCGGDFHESL
jgi:endonuclease YncB( thermonuclease family)